MQAFPAILLLAIPLVTAREPIRGGSVFRGGSQLEHADEVAEEFSAYGLPCRGPCTTKGYDYLW